MIKTILTVCFILISSSLYANDNEDRWLYLGTQTIKPGTVNEETFTSYLDLRTAKMGRRPDFWVKLEFKGNNDFYVMMHYKVDCDKNTTLIDKENSIDILTGKAFDIVDYKQNPVKANPGNNLFKMVCHPLTLGENRWLHLGSGVVDSGEWKGQKYNSFLDLRTAKIGSTPDFWLKEEYPDLAPNMYMMTNYIVDCKEGVVHTKEIRVFDKTTHKMTNKLEGNEEIKDKYILNAVCPFVK